MKKLHFTKHLLNKINIRRISKAVIIKTVQSPDYICFDTLNETNIAIKRQTGKYYIVAFSEKEEIINVVTAHPVKERQINNRIQNKRWIKIPN